MMLSRQVRHASRCRGPRSPTRSQGQQPARTRRPGLPKRNAWWLSAAAATTSVGRPRTCHPPAKALGQRCRRAVVSNRNTVGARPGSGARLFRKVAARALGEAAVRLSPTARPRVPSPCRRRSVCIRPARPPAPKPRRGGA